VTSKTRAVASCNCNWWFNGWTDRKGNVSVCYEVVAVNGKWMEMCERKGLGLGVFKFSIDTPDMRVAIIWLVG
jgi:hypothetical protein